MVTGARHWPGVQPDAHSHPAHGEGTARKAMITLIGFGKLERAKGFEPSTPTLAKFGSMIFHIYIR
jgi:hypothetical protein